MKVSGGTLRGGTAHGGIDVKARRIGFIALAVVALAAGLHGALWWRAVVALEDGAMRWAEARRAAGGSVAHGPPQRGGWPLQTRVKLPAIAVAGQDGGTQWDVQAMALDLELSLLRPTALAFALTGPFALNATAAGGDVFFARGTADMARATVPFSPGSAPSSIQVALRGPRLDTSLGQLSASAVDLRAERRWPGVPDEPTALATLTLENLMLPPESGAPLGEVIASASIEGQLVGALPAAGPLPTRLATWRDANGWVELSRVDLRWGPLSLTGTATLALDPALQPMGQAATRVGGVAQTLDLLAARGVVPRNAAATARPLLLLMSRTPPEGGPPVVELALTLQNRTLSAGRITLVRLPQVDWPR